MSTQATRTVLDHCGWEFTIPADALGLTDATWIDETGPSVAAAWVHEDGTDGTVMIPMDCQEGRILHVEDGRAIGRWVEATTGDLCMVALGVPQLAPWSRAITHTITKES
jgi:hypothetical protein